jgi:hypothetical protein
VVVCGEFLVIVGVRSGLTGCFFWGLGAGNGIFWLQKRGQNVVICEVAGVFRWWFSVELWFEEAAARPDELPSCLETLRLGHGLIDHIHDIPSELPARSPELRRKR